MKPIQRPSVWLLPLLLLAGCEMKPTSSRPTIPLVSEILANPQGYDYQLVKSFNPMDAHGDIVLLDSPDRCFALSERFLTYDVRDNDSGAPGEDGLPDFSGERIVSLLDINYTPYSRFVSADNILALREVTVRAALSALDTACCLGAFDQEKRSHKDRAKLLLISSPYLAAFGGFDVDTLFRAVGVVPPVISGPEEVFARVMDSHQGAVTIGVLSDSLTASSGAYQQIFKDLAAKRGDSFSSVFVFWPPDLSDTLSSASTDRFKRMLDEYERSGRVTALSALVVDSHRAPIDTLRAAYERILRLPSEENAYYRRMLAKDFEILDAASVTTDVCYRYLRSNNLFTHNIAYPDAGAFITSPEAPQYTLMDFDINALPADLAERLQLDAPGTYRMYVQDQYYTRGN